MKQKAPMAKLFYPFETEDYDQSSSISTHSKFTASSRNKHKPGTQEMVIAILGCGPWNPSITLCKSPFPGCLFPLYQSETWCTIIHIKMNDIMAPVFKQDIQRRERKGRVSKNELNFHLNEISFSYEGMSTKTSFEKEARGNSKMAYHSSIFKILTYITCFYVVLFWIMTFWCRWTEGVVFIFNQVFTKSFARCHGSLSTVLLCFSVWPSTDKLLMLFF